VNVKQDFVVGEERMKPSEALATNRAAIRQIVESHRARNARVFGSVLYGQDTDSSDLDILIDPTPDTTLMDVAAIQVELQRLLGVSVDVLTPNALPDSFRAKVLAEACLVELYPLPRSTGSIAAQVKQVVVAIPPTE
jgi:predicted nucleotidyltransferase